MRCRWRVRQCEPRGLNGTAAALAHAAPELARLSFANSCAIWSGAIALVIRSDRGAERDLIAGALAADLGWAVGYSAWLQFRLRRTLPWVMGVGGVIGLVVRARK
ncbi:MAG: hypothetical protein FJ100_18110 [Deltaproteobacteria bacterium]|nr:hypothetical protein [Deltaproteobacteria bacterium]